MLNVLGSHQSLWLPCAHKVSSGLSLRKCLESSSDLQEELNLFGLHHTALQVLISLTAGRMTPLKGSPWPFMQKQPKIPSVSTEPLLLWAEFSSNGCSFVTRRADSSAKLQGLACAAVGGSVVAIAGAAAPGLPLATG